VDDALDQWQRHLRACVNAEGGHFDITQAYKFISISRSIITNNIRCLAHIVGNATRQCAPAHREEATSKAVMSDSLSADSPVCPQNVLSVNWHVCELLCLRNVVLANCPVCKLACPQKVKLP